MLNLEKPILWPIKRHKPAFDGIIEWSKTITNQGDLYHCNAKNENEISNFVTAFIKDFQIFIIDDNLFGRSRPRKTEFPGKNF